MIDQGLLEMLACPLCQVAVKLQESSIVCERCGRRYPIRDGIPVMLVEEAQLPPEGAS